MEKFNKILFFLAVFIIFLFPLLVFGAEIQNPLGQTRTVQQLAEAIARYLLVIGAPIATIMILWAGFLFMTSSGNEQKVKTAKATLTWAVVGLAVLILNWGIASIIKDILEGKF